MRYHRAGHARGQLPRGVRYDKGVDLVWMERGGGYRAVYAMTKVWMGSVKCMILLEGCEDRVLGGAEPPFLTWF